MTNGVEAAIAKVHERQAERDSLERRMKALLVQLRESQDAVDETQGLLVEEEREVEKLESMSPTRIWAALRGTRDSELDREVAERDAARYRAAVAHARHDVLLREQADLDRRIAAFGDLKQEYAEALAGKETWLRETGSPAAQDLVRISERRGGLAARAKELSEAIGAGHTAQQWLAVSEEKFGSARSWSSWDAFGGGGMLTDMMKYDRIDEAADSLRSCDLALAALSRELADLGLEAVGAVGVDGLTRGLDVWFDNIFSDLSVRSRIVDAHERVQHLQRVVNELVGELTAEHRGIAVENDSLLAERERLLTS